MSLPGDMIKWGFDIRDGNLEITNPDKGIKQGGKVIAGGPAASGIANPVITGVATNSADVSGVNAALTVVNTNFTNTKNALNAVLAVLRDRGFIEEA